MSLLFYVHCILLLNNYFIELKFSVADYWTVPLKEKRGVLPWTFSRNIYQFFPFSWKSDRVAGREGKGERAFCLLVHSLDAGTCQGRAMTSVRNQKFHLGLPRCGSNPSSAVFYCLCRHISRSLFQDWSSWDFSWHSDMRCEQLNVLHYKTYPSVNTV